MGKGIHLPASLRSFLYRQITVITVGSVVVGTAFGGWQSYTTRVADENMRQIRFKQAEKEARISHTLLTKGGLKKALEEQGFDMGFYEVDEADEEEIQ
ncbi:uncharacterized protein ACA1_048050 [Acanthamoeba castellanii str. Neff]|jgi:hypothetical protein|uniref:Uncharacterized protein n=1 Tax=Acanthamoeba castellanii (strain ATCC 30010 / Neff) TaxID=1257118 RepID=L8GFQ7_ACACF|nr:uncharacterized protein ACA1_048050 [Acanthamoeba castellanii str. Neff]ELR11016.1 hypothetical protein ACA1_048050 [Acanthamoeba castellanii str. Neff]